MKNMFNSQLLQTKKHLAMLIAMANLLCIANSFAETLKDPTQPPTLLSSESSLASETSTGPVLQSIMIGPDIHAVIINGEKVRLGQKYQSATLIKITEYQAVLRNPDMSTQTLTMDFALTKKMSASTVNATSIKRKAKPHSKTTEVSEKL